jgi:hypothetical protein
MARKGKRRGSGGKKTSVRLTGFFKTKKRGLYVGSIDELDDLITKIKKAKAVDRGLVLFLWRNEDEEEGKPKFTSYVDVQREDDGGKRGKRKPIEDDDEDTEPEEKDDEGDGDDDDEVPF